jgi:hypothetical protein
MKSCLWFFFAVLLLTSACTPGAAPADPPPTDAGGASNLPEYVVAMEISGGFAGVTEKFTLFPNGRIVFNLGGEARVNPDQLAGVYAAIEENHFFDMEEDYTLFSNCSDCFTYTITVQEGERFKSVKAEEGMPNSPQGFWTIAREINSLVNMQKE